MFERYGEWVRRVEAVRLAYIKEYGISPNLLRPKLFSEKMQWRKLFGSNSLFSILSDKFAVREFVRSRGLGHLLTIVFWSGSKPDGIPYDDFQYPIIVKSTHGSGQYMVFEERREVVDAARANISSWIGVCHGLLFSEPGYLDVPHRVIVEALLRNNNGRPPLEYKLFVFDGCAKVLQMIVVEPDRTRRTSFFTPDWQRLDWTSNSPPIQESVDVPHNVLELITIAERLGKGFDHVRIDMYDRDGTIFVGEITLYSWSGFGGLYPTEADEVMGKFWKLRWPALRAAGRMLTSRWGELS